MDFQETNNQLKHPFFFYCASPPKKFIKINYFLDFIFAIIVVSLVYLFIFLICNIKIMMFFMCFSDWIREVIQVRVLLPCFSWTGNKLIFPRQPSIMQGL